MRRPLICLCFCEALGILVSFYTQLEAWHLCIFCAGVFAIAAKISKKTVFIAAVLTFLLFGFFRMEGAESSKSEIAPYEGNVAVLSGVVNKAVLYENYAALTMKVQSASRVGAEKKQVDENVLIRLSFDGETDMTAFVYDSVGRQVMVKGEISQPDGRRNPGCFDYALYLKGRGIYTLCDVSMYQFKKGDVVHSFFHFLSVEKGGFYLALQSQMDEEAFSLLAGILFGEKSYMKEDMLEQFQLNGIAHVLAVSGLHVALLYTSLIKIFSGRRNKKVSAFIILLIFSYAALCNFSISVMRAFGMVLMSLLATHLRRRYDLVTSASAMVMLFLALNPFQLFDSGLQLSFLAAYSLGIVLPYFNIKLLEISDYLKKGWIAALGEFLAPCVIVQLSMAPLIAFHFLMFCPKGLLMNPPSVALVGMILPVGLIMFAIFLLLESQLLWLQGIACVLNFLFSALVYIANSLCNFLMQLSQWGYHSGGAGYCVAPPLGLLFLFYFLYFLFFSEMRFIAFRQNRRRLFSIFTAVCILVVCVAPRLLGMTSSVLPWKYETSCITFLDVGQGDSIHIMTENFNVLLDGGGHFYTEIGERILMPYFLKNGIDHIDLAIITHSDMDHCKGMEELSSRLPIHMLVVSSPYQESPHTYSDVLSSELVYASAGDKITLQEDVFLYVLAPEPMAALLPQNNENSLVLKLNYQGLTVLLTGDIGFDAEASLKNEGPYDLLKIAHHGSANSTSPEFLQKTNPLCAVISCGKNNSHGHPSPRVIELLENSGIMICRTDDCGAIGLRTINSNFFILQNASKQRIWKILRKER
ncbi:MAG: DNA internalization-related competence protein ComEC/Rec2 [Clostridia bacterium]|nr:DNA internalization-related competence protein ComEC/Rec2 [Clostridia bacterium]